ncbi:MAG: M48 family metallopeptidase [Dokdonella sp.]|jgi:Zn-dependent protease with chaperone function|uniref:M48 family metallopeptidase n=1 Tax=Dokdonella sp. TaxID=2291710 RepID=UPI001B621B6B|nr:M48 family metallopeptidase [Dokdonella sp.]MBP6327944.1 M48 family metallopeptidase [Dokdonella sp.]MBP6330388.1 M48 family metallopeptidase [Dokdonella sp.]HNV07528.1 M48 family metallopeptidase [Dokdonella sp.]HPW02686.1 M48 family metallopeptidase [Dokdonella sp.]
MTSLAARYFDGQSSRVHDVAVELLDNRTLRLRGAGIERDEPLEHLRVSPRLARIARTIELADGARLLLDDHPLIDQWFPLHNPLQRWVDRLERHAHAVAASIVVCVLSGAVLFYWGVPWMSDRIAAQLPEQVETRLGEEVLAQLDRFAGLAPSSLDMERQSGLLERFAALKADMPGAENHRLLFRNAAGIGPNALALPGGTVIITDQLVSLVNDDREIDAVLAHELGHQQQHHALRQTLRSSFVIVIAAMFAGDVSSASAVVVAVPTFLLQGHYSREFESEADAFALRTLAEKGTSPAWFAQAMRTLEAFVSDQGESDDSPGYLSSHPQTRERIDEAEFAGEKFAIEHPELYRERPDYDACAEDGICEDAESEEMDSDEVYECVDDDCERVEPDASLELQ